jgi:hypothetical protein
MLLLIMTGASVTPLLLLLLLVEVGDTHCMPCPLLLPLLLLPLALVPTLTSSCCSWSLVTPGAGGTCSSAFDAAVGGSIPQL